MTPVEQLRLYLNSDKPDYQDGIALLQSYGNKPATAAMLMQQRDKVRLNALLKTLYETLKATQHTAAVPAITTILKQDVAFDVVKEAATELDPVKVKLKREISDCMKEIEALRNQSFYIGRNAMTLKTRPLSVDEKEQRRKIAKQLFSESGLNNKCLNLMEDLSYYDKYGAQRNTRYTEPTEQTKIVIPVGANVFKLHENSRKYIAKLKGKIETAKQQLPGAEGKELEKLNSNISDWENKLLLEEQKFAQYTNILDDKQDS